jgi:DNA helicase HerA-like ATPase
LHGLRAYTPKEQKAVKAAAQTFRANPSFNTEAAILELGTGEALVSFLDEKGAPCIVERAKILFPLSQIGAITDDERNRLIRNSRLYGIYDKSFDRESAYEVLVAQQKQEEKRLQKEAEEEEKRLAKEAKERERSRSTSTKKTTTTRKKKSAGAKALEKTLNTTASTIGRNLGNTIVRSILGSIFKK